ncbi:Hypothetical protein NocV09_00501450 [Nannochloropsis oceanica]
MTTIRFVATSVMSSDDGLSYKTEQLEDEEAHKKRLDKEKAAHGRTLWEQLEEQKDKKKAEYDAVTKQIFAPPKALDEAEASYLQGILEQEKMRDRRRAEEEERELAAFSLARANRDLGSNGEEMVAGGGKVSPREGAGARGGAATREETGGSTGGGGNSSNGNKSFPDVKISAKIKRKEKSSKEGGKEGKEDKDSSSHHKRHKKEDKTNKKASTATSAVASAAPSAPAAPAAPAKPEVPATAAANSLAMLAAYDSDEEED